MTTTNEPNYFDIKEFKVGKNLCIEASAGTGKTFTIKEISAKLVENNVPLSKIIFVTYTEKAAGEMRDRIRQKMEECLKDAIEKKDNAKREKFEVACQEINTTLIGTIHSFCRKILKDFAYEAKMPFQMEDIDDSEASKLLDKLIRNEWKEEILKLDSKSLEENELKNIKKRILNAVSKHPNIPIHQTQENINKKNFSTSKIEFYLNKIPEINKLWKEYKLKNQFQSFSDMILRVEEIVCNSKDSDNALCERIRETYQYAIIDEFQDTNDSQWNIFKTIFLESDKNNIIVVGDPKQSIYRFQGADIGTYNKAVEQIQQKGKKFVLGTNYRSSNAMINACNELFKKSESENEGFEFYGEFIPSKVPEDESKQRKNAIFDGEKTKPIWISGILPEKAFARFVVQKIIECCEITKDKTALQIFESGREESRNVTFEDFAILVKSRTEQNEITNLLSQVGIPYILYKDKSLFFAREAKEWLSILKLLDCKNFSGSKKKILQSALCTDFFRVEINDVDNPRFDKFKDSTRETIENWRLSASQNKWAELYEKILADSKIEEHLSVHTRLQELVKIKQIGQYLFSYLYEKNASLKQTIKHLENLINKKEESDETLVPKSLEFKAVRIMTIHASKGLDFPVVISTGGLKGIKKEDSYPYLEETNENSTTVKFLSFSKDAEDKDKTQNIKEFLRLMYVAYTRASSLLILPQFENWYKAEKEEKKIKKKTEDGIEYKVFQDNPAFENKEWKFLASSIKRISGNSEFAKQCSLDNPWKLEALKKKAAKSIKFFLEEENKSSSNGAENDTFPDVKDFEKSIRKQTLYQHSYSSISKQQKNSSEICDANGKPIGEIHEDEKEVAEIIPISNSCPMDYPKGKRLGDALHKVFEELDFESFGNLQLDVAKKDLSIRQAVSNNFHQNGLQQKEEWINHSIEIVWHTMHGNFKQIKGNKKEDSTFKLTEIPKENRLPEMQFHLNSKTEQKILESYIKGFMDLVFVQKINGDEKFSILDWKSNLLKNYDSETIEETVKKEYKIQMVLYAYCLIQWLKSFKSNMTVTEIFENHFGGIYYVFLRGCKEDTDSGIYANTWDSFDALEAEYKKIMKF